MSCHEESLSQKIRNIISPPTEQYGVCPVSTLTPVRSTEQRKKLDRKLAKEFKEKLAMGFRGHFGFFSWAGLNCLFSHWPNPLTSPAKPHASPPPSSPPYPTPHAHKEDCSISLIGIEIQFERHKKIRKPKKKIGQETSGSLRDPSDFLQVLSRRSTGWVPGLCASLEWGDQLGMEFSD